MAKMFSSKTLSKFLVLLPFLLVYFGTIFQNTASAINPVCKMIAFVYMILYCIAHSKFNKNLLFATFLFLPFLLYGIYNSFNLMAGVGDGIRYLFPIVTLFYSYSIRRHLPLLVHFVIAFVVINFLVQIVNYLNWMRGIDQWFYYTTVDGVIYYNETAGLLRATGLVVFFGFYGFFNMIAFFIINTYYSGRFKRLFLFLALAAMLASISYKAIGPFLFIIFIYYYKSLYKVILWVIVAALAIYLAFPKKINEFIADIVLRIQLYITQGRSARGESYRVMWHDIVNGNFFGRGVGVFGGPASTSFDSPFYKEVSFDWYDAKWLNLPTTDTYPPHLFVELGIIGGLVYLFVLCIPLLKRRLGEAWKLVLVIYFCLFFDMLFSFSLNNLEYLLFSLVFVYPIYFYSRQNDESQNVEL